MRSARLALAGLLGTLLGATALFAGPAQASTSALAKCHKTIAAEEYAKGYLTVATDSPAYTPWFEDNSPSNGKGFESAVVYAIAKALGVKKADVKWVIEPFDSSYVPGVKQFDFDINEISYTASRAKAVTFSSSYYDVTQSIVALKNSTIVKHHTPKELKSYLYGDQIGTTGLTYILNHIKPSQTPRIYSTLDEAVAALQSGQVDALVVDTPDGQYMAQSEITNAKGKPDAVQVGQFPSTGEHYGMLFEKGNPLVGCVDTALAAIKADGTLASLQRKYLGIYNDIPTLQP